MVLKAVVPAFCAPSITRFGRVTFIEDILGKELCGKPPAPLRAFTAGPSRAGPLMAKTKLPRADTTTDRIGNWHFAVEDSRDSVVHPVQDRRIVDVRSA